MSLKSPAMELATEHPFRSPGRTRALPKGLLISFACCVFSPGALPARAGVPRTGRRVQANSSILSWLAEIGQTKLLSAGFSCKVLADSETALLTEVAAGTWQFLSA